MASDELARLEQAAQQQPNAKRRTFGWKFQCAGCRVEGHDRHQDNACLFTVGKPGTWGCAATKSRAHWEAIGEALGAFSPNGDRAQHQVRVPPAAWPVMGAAAYAGLPGRIVEAIAPYSEADPVALLLHVLVATGNMLGRGPHALVEKTEHTCGEFVVLVGDTSKARKGQSWSTPKYLLTQVDEKWATTRILSGLSSGEGLIFRVRDARYEQDKKGHTACIDEGEQDKRLLVFEPELATVLRRMQGEMNTVSSIIREAWESGDLGTLTKHTPLRATGAHISIIAHVTREELVATLNEIARANGFANRFLYALVRRSKPLPSPGEILESALAPLVTELQALVRPWHRPVRRDAAAEALWCEVYPKLSEGESGLVGAILARSEAHVLRLSILYAAFDRSDVIQEPHLRAALAVWGYCEASARQIFGQALGLTVADTILAALRKRGPMTRTEIRDLFQRNKSGAEIDAVLALLLEKGLVKSSIRTPDGGKGRPTELWEAVSITPTT